MQIVEKTVIAANDGSERAAEIFIRLLAERSINCVFGTTDTADYIFTNTGSGSENCRIYSNTNSTIIESGRLRGLIYGAGYLLRKGLPRITDAVTLAPSKKIRGHQLGWRAISNAYDAWDIDGFTLYMEELMLFGMNTVEFIPFDPKRTKVNPLMRQDGVMFTSELIKAAKALDLKVSLWYPNSEKDKDELLANRKSFFNNNPGVDYLFVPGADPGSLPADELFELLGKIRKILDEYSPSTELWPSAQMPHGYPGWGEKFVELANGSRNIISGVITGPNHAFDIFTLRQKLNGDIPIRFYPDITHTLRCEHPVHNENDDWHYAWQAALGRECPDARPCEYAALHARTSPCYTGSVSYSEGFNDDVNKAVWSALDFTPGTPVREILLDYARLYMPSVNAEKAAAAIQMLENSWQNAPEASPISDFALDEWEQTASIIPDNRRVLLCLFQAQCNEYIRIKRIKELEGIGQLTAKDCRTKLFDDELFTDEKIKKLRFEIRETAKKLFEITGMQLGTEEFFADEWERGAVLDTIDNPLTDLIWLRSRVEKFKDLPDEQFNKMMSLCLARQDCRDGEYYFSFALHFPSLAGVRQSPEFYMDIQGDRPDVNKGDLPTGLYKCFDHFELSLLVSGLSPCTDYIITAVYKGSEDTEHIRHTVSFNENTLYCGALYGGERNKDYERDFLPEGFIAVSYPLPAALNKTGSGVLKIAEPETGVVTAEIHITKSVYKSPYGGATNE